MQGISAAGGQRLGGRAFREISVRHDGGRAPGGTAGGLQNRLREEPGGGFLAFLQPPKRRNQAAAPGAHGHGLPRQPDGPGKEPGGVPYAGGAGQPPAGGRTGGRRADRCAGGLRYGDAGEIGLRHAGRDMPPGHSDRCGHPQDPGRICGDMPEGVQFHFQPGARGAGEDGQGRGRPAVRPWTDGLRNIRQNLPAGVSEGGEVQRGHGAGGEDLLP